MPECASTSGRLVNANMAASGAPIPEHAAAPKPNAYGGGEEERQRSAAREREHGAVAPVAVQHGVAFLPAVGHVLRTRAVEIRPQGDRDAGQRRMERSVVVGPEVEPLHAARDVGGLIDSLRNKPVRGDDADHARRVPTVTPEPAASGVPANLIARLSASERDGGCTAAFGACRPCSRRARGRASGRGIREYWRCGPAP